MHLTFWGVRGSLPTPGPATLRYGGNTLCVQLRCGPHLLVLDAGSGARALGAALTAPVDADILLSHTHFDHICGLPFFRPLYDKQARLRIWGGHIAPPGGIHSALLRGWEAPLMPDIHQAFRAALSFHDFTPGQTLPLHPGLDVATILLAHPGGAIGYRITWGGRSVCYITDTEQSAPGVDPDLMRFVSGTDVLIFDSTYTEDEYKIRVGWGHSTPAAAVALADAAQVGRLVLFHHEPGHDDATMDTILRAAAARRPGTIAAMEGMTLIVPAR